MTRYLTHTNWSSYDSRDPIEIIIIETLETHTDTHFRYVGSFQFTDSPSLRGKRPAYLGVHIELLHIFKWTWKIWWHGDVNLFKSSWWFIYFPILGHIGRRDQDRILYILSICSSGDLAFREESDYAFLNASASAISLGKLTPPRLTIIYLTRRVAASRYQLELFVARLEEWRFQISVQYIIIVSILLQKTRGDL